MRSEAFGLLSKLQQDLVFLENHNFESEQDHAVGDEKLKLIVTAKEQIVHVEYNLGLLNIASERTNLQISRVLGSIAEIKKQLAV